MKCPYCGKDTKNNCFKDCRIDSQMTIQVHNCLHCENPIIFILEKENILLQFPKKRFEQIPQRVQTLSPNATIVFEQTLIALSHNLTELIGTGLRKSYEILLFDYLTKIRNIPQENLKNAKLSQMAKLMENTFYATICDKIIRLYGNDAVHRESKHPEVNFEDALNAFMVLCSVIDGEFQIQESLAKLTNQNSP